MGERDQKRFAALQASLGEVGLFRRGSVQRRYMPCGKPGCRCRADPPRLHGPYHQWTRKVGGKTVTVRLSEPEARLLRGWISNAKRLDKLVAQLERLSMRLTEPALKRLRRLQRRR